MFLHIDSLYFAYPGKKRPWTIADFNLSMNAGEIVGLAGPSGQGKSTLLRLIAGLERPDRGSISIDGCLVAGEGVCVPPEKRQVGMIFQDYGLFPHMNVAQNIAYGLHGLRRAERRQRLEAMLRLVRMEGLAHRRPYETSGGQQQRTAIARALAPAPKLLLLDEPFSNLDAELKNGVRAELLDILRKTRTTCLFVSHDMADLRAVCDSICRLGQGQGAYAAALGALCSDH
ncbi:MAG: ATP-binding cassette domain-containing protein [Deltaproteobacteria bacterium]|jgi:iron(III) transport system ATP-binding protein|nr:ATP-binding cassette domain-containing protein [Deltaproteobacteria bacterium]